MFSNTENVLVSTRRTSDTHMLDLVSRKDRLCFSNNHDILAKKKNWRLNGHYSTLLSLKHSGMSISLGVMLLF
jgi:hypothetical protein